MHKWAGISNATYLYSVRILQHYYSCKNLQHYSSPWVDNFAAKISFGDRAGKVKHNSYGTLCKYKHLIYLLIPSQVASTLVPVNVTELGIPTIATSDLIIRLHCWLKLINWICCFKKMIRYEQSRIFTWYAWQMEKPDLWPLLLFSSSWHAHCITIKKKR